MKLISRAEAKREGLKRYFTGKPCKQGHVTPRYTQSTGCVGCNDHYRLSNPGKMRDRIRAWAKANPEKRKSSVERYRRNNPGAMAEACRRWRKKYPEKLKLTKRRANLKLWYGVTPEWVDQTLLTQKGCAVCGTETPQSRGGWNVDHDHATGKARGVLCGHCNRAIGLLSESPALCGAAAGYLRRHGKE